MHAAINALPKCPLFNAAFQRQAAANRLSDKAKMIIKFNVAYNIAKEELPFTKFKSEIILHKNGLNINLTYSNIVTCSQFIGVIANTLKEKTSAQIADGPYMAFLTGGDTDIAIKECVIVYGRFAERSTS